ncbi:hypothetical protein C8Q76DRAFT_710297 [Earliella scabrosa]|nr:hypothetical protein C8Q76DRAFT_710297 [Earliella scabrosa]
MPCIRYPPFGVVSVLVPVTAAHVQTGLGPGHWSGHSTPVLHNADSPLLRSTARRRYFSGDRGPPRPAPTAFTPVVRLSGLP